MVGQPLIVGATSSFRWHVGYVDGLRLASAARMAARIRQRALQLAHCQPRTDGGVVQVVFIRGRHQLSRHGSCLRGLARAVWLRLDVDCTPTARRPATLGDGATSINRAKPVIADWLILLGRCEHSRATASVNS